MNNILFVDPSGTGTTGIYYLGVNCVKFQESKSENWQEHLNFLVNYIKKNPVDIIVYEYSNYVNHNKGFDTINLFRLMGAIEGLKYTFPNIKRIETIYVKEVKSLYQNVYKKKVSLPNLNYKVGRGGGWLFTLANGTIKRLSLHMLDAYLMSYIYNNKLITG